MNSSVPTRRYFDNAATSFPKPPGVREAVCDYLDHVGASAGRGSYREALESRRLLDECRTAVRRVLGCRPTDEVIFTLNGTDALNLAIKGLVPAGSHVVTTVMDHNSVLRPLNALRSQRGITWTALPVDPRSTRLEPAALREALRRDTSLVVVNHASNVTGVLQPLAEIAALCRARGVPLLVDAAQSAGHVPIDFAQWDLDLLAAPGHKGLLGPLGTGVLVLRPEIAAAMQTWREGGTGSESELAVQPASLPDKFEAGSHNAVGLAGLRAALNWILARGVCSLRAQEEALCQRMSAGLDRVPGLAWYGPRDAAQRVGVFSVRLPGCAPAEVAAILESRYGILTRGGLHCAPGAHETIGTISDGGTTRFSLGAFHTSADIDGACSALAELGPALGSLSCAPVQDSRAAAPFTR